jgi:23S rRNA (uracil1939-C5)-methyltransferase
MSAQRATVTIDSIAAGGAGVGRLPDGRAVFVQRTAPGDQALIEVTREKKRWASGRLLKVVSTGPGRRTAPCPHYARCGGCTIEHLHYDQQLEIKARIVYDALKRIGGIDVGTMPPVTPSPNEFQYRNRVSFSLVRLLDGRVLAGFHEIDRPDRVLDISDKCLLPEPALAAAWGSLRAGWGEQASFLPSGDKLRLTLRGTARGDVGLVIDGGYSAGQPDRLLQDVPQLRSIWHRPASAAQYKLLAGEAAFDESWSDEDVALSGAVFLQVNRAVAAALEEHVLQRAQAVGGKTVVDAYCGIGLHARRLARLGYHVVGIELDDSAIAEARRDAPEGTEFVVGRVEDELPKHLPADLVIVNPPRPGLDPLAIDSLVSSKPAHIIYVSCDPATLARDLAKLEAAYTITGIQCFDLFPQTTHVETVVELACVTS